MRCSKCNKDYKITVHFNPFASPTSIIYDERICYKCNGYSKQDLINNRKKQFMAEASKQFLYSKSICLVKCRGNRYRIVAPHRFRFEDLDEISYNIAVALGLDYKAPYGIKLHNSPEEFIKMLNHKFDIILNDRGIY